ncbi:MAG: hypothetical protein CL685_00090 [Candidatus Magasanikbacteria bacterium]|nr:hypothetical protein [Candidatus Magasanikbacteria bacterium]
MKSIHIKIEKIAKSLGKTITDMAKDTGLNRNTITALYHNKVDGIKFDTLLRICDVYNIGLSDILELKGLQKTEKEVGGTFFSERPVAPFYAWMWFMINNRMDTVFFGNNTFGDFRLFVKQDNGLFVSDISASYALSKYVVDRYSEPKELEKLLEVNREAADKIRNHYYNAVEGKTHKLGQTKLESYSTELIELFLEYASYFAFLHAFDTGFDCEDIKRIAKKYKMRTQDILILSTPDKPMFHEEKLVREVDFVKEFKKKHIPDDYLETYIKKWVKHNKEAKAYLREYQYYSAKLSGGLFYAEGLLVNHLMKIYTQYSYYKKRQKHILEKEKRSKKEVQKVLHRLKIQSNPLFFYKELVLLREERKSYNKMAIYILSAILDQLHSITTIEKTYLKYLGYDEIGLLLKGFITKEVLKDRYENGVIMYIDDNDYKVAFGKEAKVLLDESRKKVNESKERVLFEGYILNQGYERNFFVYSDTTIEKTKGKILVIHEYNKTLTKKVQVAAAVVVESADKNSELEKIVHSLEIPCTYGNGDIIKASKGKSIMEVRANHGTARIIY